MLGRPEDQYLIEPITWRYLRPPGGNHGRLESVGNYLWRLRTITLMGASEVTLQIKGSGGERLCDFDGGF